ncbi:uncharacterized protein [Euphorbia lathyris]|uniref:uncharacterized protein n=1 Tax=Euphorbia lathyris TaxID=212925 RepID=UPI003313720B
MHYDDKEYIEKNFDEDTSYLDILRLCKRFFDIYSVRFKITDDEGLRLCDDEDILFLTRDNTGLPEVHVNIEEDITTSLLSFKLPEDNSSLASTISISQNPEVTNLRIVGDLKVNEKVIIFGDVIGGSNEASTIQMFITISTNFHVDNDLETISLSQTNKVFLIPLEALSHYLVAKYTPVAEDGKIGDSVYVTSDKYVENSTSQVKKNVRGKNLNKKVTALKPGEKMEVTFYNNRAVGDNHTCWSRHLGKIIRDGNICPVQVQTWRDMTPEVKDHIWGAVKDEIAETIQSKPSLSTIEVIDKCFRPQTHSHVFGYGGGIKRNDVVGSKSTKEKEFEDIMQEKEEENRNLKRKLDELEDWKKNITSRLDQLAKGGAHQSSFVSPTSNTDHHEVN